LFVIRNYVTTFGTLACALGIGYFIQNDSAAQPNPAQASVAVASDQASALDGLESIVLTSAAPAEADPAPVSRTMRPEPNSSSNPEICTLNARATARPGAMARLSIKAPCQADTRVEIHHSGLTLTQRTDSNGKLDLTIPALSEYAIFLISFADQSGTVATTHISDIDNYDRVALQWRGPSNLQIHALEFGASYGAPGHVWAGQTARGEGDVVHLGQAGFSDALNAEIYSFPTGQSENSGPITLTVEAEVTQENCGGDLNLQSLERRSDNRLRSQNLTLSMPDCSRAGEFLVLNNLLADLTIAAK